MVDLTGHFREKMGIRHHRWTQALRRDRQRAIGPDPRWPRRGAGRRAFRGGEQHRLARRRAVARPQVQVKFPLLRHANLVADQPARGGLDGPPWWPWRGPWRGARRHRHGQQHLAAVAEGHDRPFRQPLGHRPIDRTRLRAQGEHEGKIGRDPRVPRVLPVGMPPRRQPQPQRQPIGGVRCRRIRIGHQAHHGARAAHRHALRRHGGRGDTEKHGQERQADPHGLYIEDHSQICQNGRIARTGGHAE